MDLYLSPTMLCVRRHLNQLRRRLPNDVNVKERVNAPTPVMSKTMTSLETIQLNQLRARWYAHVFTELMIVQDCVRDDNLNTNTPTKPSQAGVNPTTPTPSEKIYGSSPPFSPPNVSPSLQLIHFRSPSINASLATILVSSP